MGSSGGTRQQIVNNYFHDIGYVPTARVITMGGSDHLVSHNTVRKFARSFLDGFPLRSEFAYNLFEDGANLSWDTGVFDGDAGRGNGGGSVVHHNVIRDVAPVGVHMGFYSGVDLTFTTTSSMVSNQRQRCGRVSHLSQVLPQHLHRAGAAGRLR